MGRHSLYSDDLAETIAEALAAGESLARIGERDDMPSLRTMIRWANEHEGFGAIYACAREAQAEVMDDLILAAARDAGADPAAARVKIDAYKWRAARLNPRKFGDATTVKHADANGEKMPVDDATRVTRLAAIVLALRQQDSDATD